MPVYYLTVMRDGVEVVRRQQCADYAEAVAFTSRYYRVKPPIRRAVLKFYTEAINGQFARSYATLTRERDIGTDRARSIDRHAAIKQENAFEFDASYLFLIESEVGRADQEAWADDGE